jgi:hypothetical protein
MENYNKALTDGSTVTVPIQEQYSKPLVDSSPVILTDDYSIVAADNGKTFMIATDAKVISLPATIADFEVTIINSGAAGNNIVTISPVAADGIAGTITLAASVVTRVGTVDTDLVNTKATATLGDSVKLKGTGVTGTGAWFILSSTGIWA